MAGADDVPVRRKTVIDAVDLLELAGLREAVCMKAGEDLSGQLVIGLSTGPTEVVETHPESGVDARLHLELFIAEGGDILLTLCGSDLRGGAVLVGATDVEHLLAMLTQESGVDVGREHGAHEVAEVLHTVDVGEAGGDEVSHAARLSRGPYHCRAVCCRKAHVSSVVPKAACDTDVVVCMAIGLICPENALVVRWYGPCSWDVVHGAFPPRTTKWSLS